MKTVREFLSSGVRKADKMFGMPSLGIPRAVMPQIKSAAYDKFISYLLDKGIPVQEIPDVNIGEIQLTQSDIDLDKVREMIDDLDGFSSGDIERGFIVSSEYRLLDGHHRYLALLYSGEVTTLPVIRIGITMRELIPLAHTFSKSSGRLRVTEEKIVFTAEEMAAVRRAKKAYREMSFYQHRSRNLKTTYAKRKFLESFKTWHETLRGTRKAFGTLRGKHLIDIAMRPARRRVSAK